MIKDENLEETRVGLGVYKKYQELSGGWLVFGIIMIIMVVFTGLKMMGDYWIGLWAKSLSSPDSNFGFYCSMIFFFTIATSVLIFIRTMIFVRCNLKLMNSIHKQMIFRIMDAPISLYFDVTPIGRILNKFSKDLQVIDSWIFWMVGTQLSNIF